MKYTFSIIVGALLFTLYLLCTNQDPGKAVGLNRFEEASNMLSNNP